MRSKVLLCVVVAGAAVLVVLGGAPPALAASSDVGKNVGDEIKSWDTSILLGVAGLVALPVLFKRDVGGGVTLALLVVLVGGFAFAPQTVENVIQSLWHTVAG